MKRNIRRNVVYLLLKETFDDFLFRAFVLHLITVGTLVEWDISVVDNCYICSNGENSELSFLWKECKIFMVHLSINHLLGMQF